MVLNSSLATWITNVTKSDNGTTIGHLYIPEVTHIHTDMSVTSGDLVIVIDITNQLVMKATFEQKCLSMNDAIALAFIAWAGHTHPVIHSYANWAVNPYSCDRFIRKMSVITIIYNYFGLESFPAIVELLRKLRICKFTSSEIARLVVHQGPHTVPTHSNILAIQKYSGFLEFLNKTRQHFLKEFCKYKEDFSGMDGEALFLGTVLHSVDHQQMASQVKTSNFKGTAEFAADQEMASVILSSFVDKPILRMVDFSFCRSPHPFFRDVFKFASTVDARLADMMECAIAM